MILLHWAQHGFADVRGELAGNEEREPLLSSFLGNPFNCFQSPLLSGIRVGSNRQIEMGLIANQAGQGLRF